MACPAENWEFPPPPGQQPINTNPVAVCTFTPPCPGVGSVVLVNTSQFPLAYTAETAWAGSGYPPGVAFGGPNELAGVLNPGDEVDITSVYVGGVVAVLGSAHPFSSPDASKYAGDEGTIPWPAGVAGSGGATQMFVAQITIVNSCIKPNLAW
jgi:hypothetical protein